MPQARKKMGWKMEEAEGGARPEGKGISICKNHKLREPSLSTPFPKRKRNLVGWLVGNLRQHQEREEKISKRPKT